MALSQRSIDANWSCFFLRGFFSLFVLVGGQRVFREGCEEEDGGGGKRGGAGGDERSSGGALDDETPATERHDGPA